MKSVTCARVDSAGAKQTLTGSKILGRVLAANATRCPNSAGFLVYSGGAWVLFRETYYQEKQPWNN